MPSPREANVKCPGLILLLQEMLAEFFGTCILMVFGMGSVAQLVLSNGAVGSADQVRWSWGLGVMFGVFIAGGHSGGHLNPAVTLTFALFGKKHWSRVGPYWLAQYLGSFFASFLVFSVYRDAIDNFDSMYNQYSLQTAGIFCTFPQEYVSSGTAFGDQVFGTALLMAMILAFTDKNNVAPHPTLVPVLVGLVVVGIGMTFSLNCGYPLNPARDLAPRFFTSIAGWGGNVFTFDGGMWWWLAVLGPHTGAIVGGTVYELLINRNIPFAPCFENQTETTPNAVHSQQLSLDTPETGAVEGQKEEAVSDLREEVVSVPDEEPIGGLREPVSMKSGEGSAV